MNLIKLSTLLFASALASPAFAQQAPSLESLDVRLDRVERVLDQSLLEQLQRVDALQREIRALRGELENVNYELNTVKRREADLYADTNRRLTDLEDSKSPGIMLDEEGVLIPGALSDETVSILDETVSPAVSATEPEPAVFVRDPSPAVVIPNIADFGDGPKPPTEALREAATNAEKQAYNKAYDLLARGQIPESMQSFDQFLLQYPNGPYSDNAWYWQGEAHYAQQQFDLALRNFNVVVSSFPNSPKVPDARLKIGYSFYEKQDIESARSILTAVQDDYPGRSASVLATKRLQKMDREGR
ncbi:MAG: tol-pal system protein YbgF [Granulosicoccus sp.]